MIIKPRGWAPGLAIAMLLLAACGGSQGSPAASEIGDPSAGRQVFETGGSSQIPCASCHTLDGTALVGPSLQGIAERAATRRPDMSATEYLRESIISPSTYVVEGYDDVMNKDYGEKLSSEEIDNLIAFLMTQ